MYCCFNEKGNPMYDTISYEKGDSLMICFSRYDFINEVHMDISGWICKKIRITVEEVK